MPPCGSPSLAQVLVLAPTREIALQASEAVALAAAALPPPGLTCGSFIGGLPVEEDEKQLRRCDATSAVVLACWRAGVLVQVLASLPNTLFAAVLVERTSERCGSAKLTEFPVSALVCRACHVAVGTTGRLLSLVQRGSLRTSALRMLVLDEADKLLGGECLRIASQLLLLAAAERLRWQHAVTDGLELSSSSSGPPQNTAALLLFPALADSFRADTLELLEATPQRRQLLALSATYAPSALQELRRLMGGRQQEVRLCADDTSLLGVRQCYRLLGAAAAAAGAEAQADAQAQQQQQGGWGLGTRLEALLRLLGSVSFQQAVVFCKYKAGACSAAGSAACASIGSRVASSRRALH